MTICVEELRMYENQEILEANIEALVLMKKRLMAEVESLIDERNSLQSSRAHKLVEEFVAAMESEFNSFELRNLYGKAQFYLKDFSPITADKEEK